MASAGQVTPWPLPPGPVPVRAGGDQGLFTELNTRRLGPVRRYFLRHPVAMDLVVAGCFLVPTIITAALDPDRPRLLLIALALVGTAVLMWRRRSPMWTAAVIGALGVLALATTGTISGFDLAVGFAIYAVAASRPPRTAWLTLAVLCVVVSAAVLLWGEPLIGEAAQAGPYGPGITVQPGDGETLSSMRAEAISTVVIFALGAIAIGTTVRNRRVHVSALIDRANRIAVERDQQVQLAAAAERTRIAREMHDVVAHSLSVMIALADGAGVALDRSPDRAREAVAELSATGRSALADMRRVLGILREPGAPLGPAPGATDLAELVERFRSAGLPVRTTFAGAPLPRDAGLQLAVFRIVQESLTNALRHAPGAGRVDLVLAHADGRVEITVTDDGGARQPTPPRRGDEPEGKGVIGMRERAAVYGGVVEAGPRGGGWRTRAVLTWTEETGVRASQGPV